MPERRIYPVADTGRMAATDKDTIPGSVEKSFALGEALAHLARTRFRMLFVQPARNSHDLDHNLPGLGFRTSAADLAPPGSVQVDLTRSRDQLFGDLRKTVRRAVRKAPDRGVQVRLGDHRDVAALARLMATTAQHRGFDALSEAYVEQLYTALAPAGHAAIFMAEVHGQLVAANLFTICGDTVLGRLAGMDRSNEFRAFSAPAVTEWETMLWAKHHGYRWYDVGGLGEPTLRALVDGHTSDPDSWDSADRYKLGFGGTAYRNPTPVEWIRPWPLRQAHELSRRVPAGRAVLQHAAQRLRGGRRSQVTS
jgi:hypothetical protein